MRPISTFTVGSDLPEALAPLRDLAMNLRWTWHRPTVDLFRELDPDAFETSGGNPIAMLPLVPVCRLQQAAREDAFLTRMRQEQQDLDDYLSSDRWYQRTVVPEEGEQAPVAYFSMEFGLSPTLPIYSGGLGILSGDHLKSASDLGVPLVAVGLLYQWGYFSQSLDASGWQQEDYRHNDPDLLPIRPVRRTDGQQLTVDMSLPGGRHVAIAVWKVQVGRVPLLLLDTDVDGNDEDARAITDRLYGGDSEHRILQELVLGVGGVRAVTAFSEATGAPEPTVFHLNEGHAGFSGLERLGRLMEQGKGFDEALVDVRSGTVFTTHTPVPAGIDRFDVDTLRHYLDPDEQGRSRTIGALPVEAALALGIEDDGGAFNMAHMGFRLAQRANGVSQLHGAVSRAMFRPLYAGFDADEVPIGAVTNGVHRRTWTSQRMDALYTAALGDADISSLTDWSGLAGLSDQDLTETRDGLRAELVTMARRCTRDSLLRRGFDAAEIGWADDVLDPSALTIGFARRVSTYKRLTLMLQDPERLRRILLDDERPVQFVIAGKAHPADVPGKEFMQRLVQFADDAGVRHRIVFLPDYDIRMAQVLVAGADVWLNNPIRPEEASGTSGMKAVLNGGLTFSISDGWWDEMATDEAGWTIPTAQVEDRGRRDRIEAGALYDLLEHRIVPLFHERGQDGLRHAWLEKVRTSLTTIAPRVTASRMVREYTTELYLPAARAARAFHDDPAFGAGFSAWKQHVAAQWGQIWIGDVRLDGAHGPAGDRVAAGTEVTVSAAVDLAGLAEQDVTVEAVVGSPGATGELEHPELIPMRRGEDGRFLARLVVGRPGPVGYTVRVVPHHPALAARAELGLVTTA
jgi:starch phosphorylase